MAVEFRLPDLGEGMTEGELVRWLIKPGDRVTLDQAIAEVQTDKAVVELPAPVAGTILSLDVEEGRVVPVGTRLLTIEDATQDSVPTIPTSEEDAAVAAAERTGAAAAAGARRAGA
ncbi:MAG TPA: biotin/lipoyl-containing protein, partial [Chloroflexota bacterium]|nr:biotin/lipoyl-containing protein [Chloroflexota bacterium]